MTSQNDAADYGEESLSERERLLLDRLRSVIAEIHSELSREATVHLVCLVTLSEVRRITRRIQEGHLGDFDEVEHIGGIAAATAAIAHETTYFPSI